MQTKPTNDSFASSAVKFLLSLGVVLTLVGWLGVFFDISAIKTIISPSSRPDYFDYYAAFQLFLRGINPYDVPAIEDVIKHLPYPAPSWHLVRMYYPPWTLPIFAPLLILPMQIGSPAWLLAMIISLYASSLLVFAALVRRTRSIVVPVIASLCCVPAFEVLRWGQSGLFVLLGHALFFFLLARRRDVLGGACLVLVALKLHLAAAYFVGVGLWALGRKRYGVLLGAAGALLMLFGITSLLSPSIYTHYFEMSQEMLPYVSTLKGANIAYLFRWALVDRVTGIPPTWPQYVVPIASVLITLLLYLKNTKKFSLGFIYAVVLPLSVACAPSSWLHDSACLLMGELLFLVAATEQLAGSSDFKRAILYFGTIQVATLVMQCLVSGSHLFWWVPVAHLVAALVLLKQNDTSLWEVTEQYSDDESIKPASPETRTN